MSKVRFALVLLAALLVVGAQAQEKPRKGRLPARWSKLLPDLTATQVAKLCDLDVQARAELKALHEKIAAVKARLKKDQLQVLTEAQRKVLTEAKSGKSDK
jgi:hypothetical protein